MTRKVKHLLFAVLLAGLALTLTLTATPSRADSPPTFLFMWGRGVNTGAETFEICSVATVCQAGSSGSGDGQFSFPAGVAVDSHGNVYVADSGNNRIQKFDSNGTFLAKWDSSGSPVDVAVDSTGNVYVVDTLNNRVQKFDSNGTFDKEWGSPGTGIGQFNQPTGVAVDSAGNVYVADQLNHRFQKFDGDGNYLSEWGSLGAGDGQFNRPTDVAVDSAGNVYVVDSGNYRIQKFDSGGGLIKWGSLGVGNGQFVSPAGIAVDGMGNVYVTERIINPRIQKFDSNGNFLTTWGSPGSGAGMFTTPANLAIDHENSVYVVEESNHRVQKFGQRPLMLTKIVNNDTPHSGQRITYTITVDNDGTVTATNAVISDTLPDGLTWAGSVKLEGSSGITDSPPILASGLTISVGQRITVTFPVTVNTGLAPNTIITNTATVTSTEVVTPQTGSKVITINPVNLTLIKAVNTNLPNPGQRITYTITVNNSGLNKATEAVISDTLPDGLTFAGPVTLEGTSGTTGTPPILASNLTITAGTGITLTFPVTVNTGQDNGTIIINTAAVTSAEVTTPQSDPELIILLDTISPTFPITDLLTGSPLITPTLGVLLDTARPIFEWYAAWDNGQVLTYILTLSSTAESLSLQATTDSIATTQTSFTPTIDLPIGVYTWTLQAQDAAGNKSKVITPQNFIIQAGMQGSYLPVILKGVD